MSLEWSPIEFWCGEAFVDGEGCTYVQMWGETRRANGDKIRAGINSYHAECLGSLVGLLNLGALCVCPQCRADQLHVIHCCVFEITERILAAKAGEHAS